MRDAESLPGAQVIREGTGTQSFRWSAPLLLARAQVEQVENTSATWPKCNRKHLRGPNSPTKSAPAMYYSYGPAPKGVPKFAVDLFYSGAAEAEDLAARDREMRVA